MNNSKATKNMKKKKRVRGKRRAKGVNPASYMRTGFHHVPKECVADIEHIITVIREGFAVTAKPKPRKEPPLVDRPGWKDPKKGHKKPPANLNKDNPGKILRIVLFGDAVQEQAADSFCYDIFVEVNQLEKCGTYYWAAIREQLAALPYPVYLRVDHARGVNSHIKKAHPFYTHVMRDGVLLYQQRCSIQHCIPKVESATPKQTAANHMEQFLTMIAEHREKENRFREKGNYRRAGFEIYHSIALAYHMLLTVHQGYSYPEYDLAFLRERTKALLPTIKEAWIYRDQTFEKEFEWVCDARFRTYKATKYHGIGDTKLSNLYYRLKSLLRMSKKLCEKKIEQLA